MSKIQKFTIEASQEEDFPKWYKETLIKGEILEYHDINGCYVLRPNGYFMWKKIQEEFNKKIEELGVEEAYFPMLLSKSALEKEKDHLDSFSPEVAWITECGGKVLENPVAIRPTSEAIIYPYFSKWIQSYRDLPMKVNQWCNILRWETTQTMPFIRGREFLWQEGHTVHYTREEADKEVYDILEFYKEIYEDLLAVYVIKGMKSKKETFAGADFTTTVETFIPFTGKGIQAATSHSLGTNFSKMFDVSVESPTGGMVHLYQNSWGLSTRSLGVSILTHSDNRGLVMPPKVAPVQVVIVPCGKPSEELSAMVTKIYNEIKSKNIRVKIDDTDNSAGYKFNYWEVRGTPLRIEIGPKDLISNQCILAFRMDNSKKKIDIKDISETVANELELVHTKMFYNSKNKIDTRIVTVTNIKELSQVIKDKCIGKGVWCGDESCEILIKEHTTEKESNGNILTMGCKSLCILFEKQEGNCFNCLKQTDSVALFGRCY